MVLGKKIQNLDQHQEDGRLGYALTPYELSRLMRREDDNLTFYRNETIQDIIEL